MNSRPYLSRILLPVFLLLSAGGASTASEPAALAPRVQSPARAATAPMRFAIVADRTGGHRPGVFEAAVARLNLLAPDFVMSVGDFIEGYTTDKAELVRQWDEFDAMIGKLEPEFIRVPGNHDLSNQEARAIWHDRFGPTYSAFVRNQCLFLCLNSEDPTSGRLGADQLDHMRRAVRQNPDVRWTFVFMHEPLWTYPRETGWSEMEKILGDRPRTVFAGHMHEYRHEIRHGCEYITLGTTGGGGPTRGVNYGEVDHVTWVTIADGPPHIANLELSGVWDTAMYSDEVKAGFKGAVTHRPVFVEPVLLRDETFQTAETRVRVTNPTSFPLTVIAHASSDEHGVGLAPGYFEFTVPPDGSATRTVTLSSPSPLPPDAVPALTIEWKAAYAVPARPPIETHGAAQALVLPADLKYPAARLPEGVTPAEIVTALHQAGHDKLAAAAVGVYAPCTRTTADALALVKEARAIGVSDELGSRLGFICDWRLGGLADWKFADGLRTTIPATTTTAVPGGAWHLARGNPDTGIVDLLKAVGDRQNTSVLAATEVVVGEAGDAVMHLRSDDGIALWLNGERVHANNATRGVFTGEDHVPVRLRHGDNTIVVEITQGIEGWGFSVRMTRPDGTPYPFAAK